MCFSFLSFYSRGCYPVCGESVVDNFYPSCVNLLVCVFSIVLCRILGLSTHVYFPVDISPACDLAGHVACFLMGARGGLTCTGWCCKVVGFIVDTHLELKGLGMVVG